MEKYTSDRPDLKLEPRLGHGPAFINAQTMGACPGSSMIICAVLKQVFPISGHYVSVRSTIYTKYRGSIPCWVDGMNGKLTNGLFLFFPKFGLRGLMDPSEILGNPLGLKKVLLFHKSLPIEMTFRTFHLDQVSINLSERNIVTLHATGHTLSSSLVTPCLPTCLPTYVGTAGGIFQSLTSGVILLHVKRRRGSILSPGSQNYHMHMYV